ncbi:hypothetical protein D3C85_1018980 [compost metagenome]
MRLAISLAASPSARLGRASAVSPNNTSQRSKSSAFRSGMATCLGMGMPEKRRVPSSTADQKSDSVARCSSQSWIMPLKMGPSASSARALP